MDKVSTRGSGMLVGHSATHHPQKVESAGAARPGEIPELIANGANALEDLCSTVNDLENALGSVLSSEFPLPEVEESLCHTAIGARLHNNALTAKNLNNRIRALIQRLEL